MRPEATSVYGLTFLCGQRAAEDILSFRRLERLYPEMWPERLKAEVAAAAEAARRMQEEEARKKLEYQQLLGEIKTGARAALGDRDVTMRP
jgi:hypothetical protein